jgi:hypothetical protein
MKIYLVNIFFAELPSRDTRLALASRGIVWTGTIGYRGCAFDFRFITAQKF